MKDKKLFLKEEIVNQLKEKYNPDNVCIVSTEGYDLTTNPSGRNSKKDRSEWADSVVCQLYNGTKRSEIIKKEPRLRSTGEYNFSYIKFACNDAGDIYGIVNGMSSFHKMYPSDVFFYDLDEYKKEVSEYMKDNVLEWYTKEILILKNDNVLEHKEAYKHEKEMKELFGLFD